MSKLKKITDLTFLIPFRQDSSAQYASDGTAWCSAFVNYCVEQNGHQGTDSARASDWNTFGTADSQPHVGDIAYRNGHCVIVSSVGSNGAFTMIAGNSGANGCVAYESYGSSSGYSYRSY